MHLRHRKKLWMMRISAWNSLPKRQNCSKTPKQTLSGCAAVPAPEHPPTVITMARQNAATIFFFINKTPFFLVLGNSNFGIITLTRNLRYELLDKSFSISVLHLINFLILCTLNQVDFTGIQAPIYKKPPQPHYCGRGGF